MAENDVKDELVVGEEETGTVSSNRWSVYPVLLALVLGLIGVLAEAGYRVYLYSGYIGDVPVDDLLLVDQPLFVFDEEVGFRYPPDAEITLSRVDADNTVVLQNTVMTNNMGWLSRNDYSLLKQRGEYRIAVIGGSNTGNLQNTITWTDALQDLLNVNDALKAVVEEDRFTVLNFSQDDAGLENIEAMFTNDVLQYAPDFIIVNFTLDAIEQDMMWRESMPVDGDYGLTPECVQAEINVSNTTICRVTQYLTAEAAAVTDPTRLDAMRAGRHRTAVRSLPWFSLHSEITSQYEGIRRLDLTVVDNLSIKTFKGQAFGSAVTRLRNMEDVGLAFLPLLHPTYDMLTDEGASNAASSLVMMVGDVDIQNMQDYLPVADAATVDSWFHLSYDDSMNDAGQRMYAQAVYEMLVTDYWSVR